jgi:hypothetical protein
MSGEASRAFSAVVVLGWVAIQTTIGPSFLFPSSSRVEKRAAFRVLNTWLLEQSNDHRSDDMPDRVELRSEDSLGGLGRDLKNLVPGAGTRKGFESRSER